MQVSQSDSQRLYFTLAKGEVFPPLTPQSYRLSAKERKALSITSSWLVIYTLEPSKIAFKGFYMFSGAKPWVIHLKSK